MSGDDALRAADVLARDRTSEGIGSLARPEPVVTLRPIDAKTRTAVLALRVRPEQSPFVATPTTYLQMCEAEDVWQPLAVLEGEQVVGFLMWGVDDEDDSCWLGGFIIDAAHQGRGLGRAAALAALELLDDHGSKAGFALSYEAENTTAAGLYTSLGFVPSGERVDDEVVARRPPSRQGA